MSIPAGAQNRTPPPPNVLRALWDEVYREATGGGPAPYDPEIYTAVFRRWLWARHVEVIPIGQALDGSTSAYAFGIPTKELIATPTEVAATMTTIDRLFSTTEES